MDSKMKENILNYAEQIETLSTFVEAVRKMPGMYIGHRGNSGYLNVAREVIQNGFDEMNKEDSPCDRVIVSYDENNHTFIVEDNGRGLPHDNIIRICTSDHTSSNYTKKEGEFSAGRHGVGLKVAIALCSMTCVESYIFGVGRRIEFKDGVPTTENEVPIKNPRMQQGTVITFEPCYEILGDITLTCEEVEALLRKLIMLTNHIGDVCIFNGIKSDGTKYTEKIVNTDGILTDLINKTSSPIIKPIIISDNNGIMKADIAFTYDSSDDSTEEEITSFANYCPTTGGTHVKGFLSGLEKYFRTYMNKIFLNTSNGKKKNKLFVNNNDIHAGLKCIIAACHLNPDFSGQAKEVLDNADMVGYVQELTYNYLNDVWSKENPTDLQKLCKMFKDIAELRVNSENAKEKVFGKYKQTGLSGGLPAKYEKPSPHKGDKIEIIVVEGDSAGGSAKNKLNHRFQGLMPIRGKIPNAFTKTKAEFFNNEEVAGLWAIIFDKKVNHGVKLTPEIIQDVLNRVDKVIFGADADPDGYHIRCLLLKYALRYMKELVEAGLFYAAMPPLYGLKQGNNTRFFIDKVDYAKYIQSSFARKYEIVDVNGRPFKGDNLTKLLVDNWDYTYQLDKVSNTYAIDKDLLETILFNINDTKSMRKTLENKFRFLDIKEQSNSLIMEGTVNKKFQTVFFNDRLVNECGEVLNILNKNENQFFYVNGELKSLYQLMAIYQTQNKGLTRYKGLGEMSPEELEQSTIGIGSGRTLIQYTVESMGEEIDKLKYYESHRAEIIRDTVATRNDLIG